MIDWLSRERGLPANNREVLAWGLVPADNAGMSSVFLGPTRYNGANFSLDGTGHCGLVRVTHWAEITGPQEKPTVATAKQWKMLAWIDDMDVLQWVYEGRDMSSTGWKRVPAEDKLCTVEE